MVTSQDDHREACHLKNLGRVGLKNEDKRREKLSELVPRALPAQPQAGVQWGAIPPTLRAPSLPLPQVPGRLASVTLHTASEKENIPNV